MVLALPGDLQTVNIIMFLVNTAARCLRFFVLQNVRKVWNVLACLRVQRPIPQSMQLSPSAEYQSPLVAESSLIRWHHCSGGSPLRLVFLYLMELFSSTKSAGVNHW